MSDLSTNGDPPPNRRGVAFRAAVLQLNDAGRTWQPRGTNRRDARGVFAQECGTFELGGSEFSKGQKTSTRSRRSSCIFDAFQTTKPGGIGMGLAISRSIINWHGGKLRAISNDGPGATFQFTLSTESHFRGTTFPLPGQKKKALNCDLDELKKSLKQISPRETT